jgi:hypothetical protein
LLVLLDELRVLLTGGVKVISLSLVRFTLFLDLCFLSLSARKVLIEALLVGLERVTLLLNAFLLSLKTLAVVL